ncbi:MAG: ZIP family metal transporter [Candidatus Aenigmarchaeota archaeon]|nr:ZIP family metal transporter [Candidatus Aenigmarchaeota archaeon]
MAADILLILASVVIVSLISVVGVVTLSLRKDALAKVLMLLVALGAGTLIGGALFDLIPEALELGGNVALQYIAGGIVLFFVIERVIHAHHHHHITEDSQEAEHLRRPFAVLNLIGEAIHNFLDGTIIAASYLLGFELGVAATIAIIFHEIPQEIGDFGILVKGGFSVRKALQYNLLVALTAVVGALVVVFAAGLVEGLELFLISIAGGGFLYIALANLIPELHHERSTVKQVLQTIFLIVGIALLFVITTTFVE